MERETSQPIAKCSFSYKELMGLEMEKPSPVVEGLLYERQNGMLAGQYAVGKTFLSLQMSLCLATGRDFLGRKTRKSRVAFVDGENDKGDIKGRIRTQAAALGITDIPANDWNYATTKELDSTLANASLDEVGLRAINRHLEEHKPEVLILDNLGWFLKGDMEDSEDVQEFYRTLRAIREKHESLQQGVILFLHHLTKPGDRQNAASRISLLDSPREYLYQARGSGRLVDFAEARLGLACEKAEGNDGDKFIVLNGVNRSSAEVVPLLMRLNPETLCFEFHENRDLVQQKVFQRNRKKRELFERLPAEFSFTDAVKFHGTKGTVNDTIRIACEAGLLEKRADGRYIKTATHSMTNPADSLDSLDKVVQ